MCTPWRDSVDAATPLSVGLLVFIPVDIVLSVRRFTASDYSFLQAFFFYNYYENTYNKYQNVFPLFQTLVALEKNLTTVRTFKHYTP